MSPLNLNQAPTIPIEEEEIDPGQASSFSCPSFFGSRHDPRAYRCMGRQEERVLPHPFDSKDDGTLKLSLCDPCVPEEGVVADTAGQWMSSKMRFMRKMMNSSHIVVSNQPSGSMLITPDDQSRSHRLGYSGSNQSNNSPSGIIRVCSDCNTTKTPLWRSGPRGPKIALWFVPPPLNLLVSSGGCSVKTYCRKEGQVNRLTAVAFKPPRPAMHEKEEEEEEEEEENTKFWAFRQWVLSWDDTGAERVGSQTVTRGGRPEDMNPQPRAGTGYGSSISASFTSLPSASEISALCCSVHKRWQRWYDEVLRIEILEL
ncbi:hypothetical protein BHE74_00025357 [Ensete ventricosum]|nr:hypothetical protein BHE74_00025357 [Ensete ventricosum]